MASQGQTVSLYHKKLRSPQSIAHSIYGRFTAAASNAPTIQEFILIRGNSIIELIQTDTSISPPIFTTICTYNTQCFIRDIKPLTFPDHDRTYIALATDTGILTILRYNSALDQFEPITSEMYGRSGIRRAVAGQFIATDPHGRSVMIAATERQKIAYGISTEMQQNDKFSSTVPGGAPQRVYNITSGVEYTASNTQTFALVGLYTEPYNNPLYAAIEVSYNEVTQTITNTINNNPNNANEILKTDLQNPINKFQPLNMCKYLTIYEHEVNVGDFNKLTKIASIPIPSTAHDLIPIPITHVYTGGVVVLCENCCFYYPINIIDLNEATTKSQQYMRSQMVHDETYTMLQGIRCNYPIRFPPQTIATDTTTSSASGKVNNNNSSNKMNLQNTLINSYTTYLLINKKTHRFFIYLQTEFGDIFQLELLTLIQQDQYKSNLKQIELQLLSQPDANIRELTEIQLNKINIVEELRCIYLDTLPPGIQIHLTNRGQLFLTSDISDSGLYQLKVRDITPDLISYAYSTSLLYNMELNTTVYYYLQQYEAHIKKIFNLTNIPQYNNNNNNTTSITTTLSLPDHYQNTNLDHLLEYLPEDYLNTMQFIPTPLVRLTHLAVLPSYTPLRSTVFVPTLNPTLNNVGTLYTAYGTTSRSYLSLNKFCNVFEVQNDTELDDKPLRIYNAITNINNPKDTIVALTYANHTQFVSISTGVDSLSLEQQNFEVEGKTLYFGSIIDRDNTKYQLQSTLLFNHAESVYLNRIALIQVTTDRVICMYNDNTAQPDVEHLQSLLNNPEVDPSEYDNPITQWNIKTQTTTAISGTPITCADANAQYIVIAAGSQIRIFELSQQQLIDVLEPDIDQGYVISQLYVYKPTFNKSANGNSTTKDNNNNNTGNGNANTISFNTSHILQQIYDNSLFFVTIGEDSVLRTYKLISTNGQRKLELCDQQILSTSNPSSLLLSMSKTNAGHPMSALLGNNTLQNADGTTTKLTKQQQQLQQQQQQQLASTMCNFFNCYVVIEDFLYQYVIDPFTCQFTQLDPIQLKIGSLGPASKTNLCQIPLFPTSGTNTPAVTNTGGAGNNNNNNANNNNNNNNNTGNNNHMVNYTNNNAYHNTSLLSTVAEDIIICNELLEPQVLHNDKTTPLCLLKRQQLIDEEGNMIERPKHPNYCDYMIYNTLDNAIWLDSPVGQFLIGHSGTTLLIISREQTLPQHQPLQYYDSSALALQGDETIQSIVPYNNNNANNKITNGDSNATGNTSHLVPNDITPLHSTSLTYTCRGLHHINIEEMCFRYKIQHQPVIKQQKNNTQQQQQKNNLMSDAIDNTNNNNEMTDNIINEIIENENNNTLTNDLPPYETTQHIIQNSGVTKLSKQSGQLLITIEGDDRQLSKDLQSTFFQQSQQYLYQDIENNIDENIQQQYTIKKTIDSNTKTLTGGNPIEYHIGYNIGNEYHGCIRLLHPITLSTHHVISTPKNMCITSSCCTVLNEMNVIILGGHYTTPPHPPSPDGIVYPTTTGLLATYELYYSPTSQQWAVKFLHLTQTPHRVTAIAPIYYNQTLLIAQSDELCIYEYGKRQLLFKSKFALKRGVIATITPTHIYSLLDHTGTRNTTLYIGLQGQGLVMVRLGILLPPAQPIPTPASTTPQQSNSLTNSLATTTPAAAASSATTGASTNYLTQQQQQQQQSTKYSWGILSATIDNRYVLSATSVIGGTIIGDRFGNIALYGLSQDDIISLIKDPMGYATDPTKMNSTTSTLGGVIAPVGITNQGFYLNEHTARINCFADIHLGSPITNIFSLYTTPRRVWQNKTKTVTPASLLSSLGNNDDAELNNVNTINAQLEQCILYTTLNGQIGVLKPLTDPNTNGLINKILLYAYNQISLTGSLYRKYLSYWNPTMNIIDGEILLDWLYKLKQYHSLLRLNGTTALSIMNLINSNKDENNNNNNNNKSNNNNNSDNNKNTDKNNDKNDTTITSTVLIGHQEQQKFPVAIYNARPSGTIDKHYLHFLALVAEQADGVDLNVQFDEVIFFLKQLHDKTFR